MGIEIRLLLPHKINQKNEYKKLVLILANKSVSKNILIHSWEEGSAVFLLSLANNQVSLVFLTDE